MKKNLPSILEAMALSAGLAFIPGCPGDEEEEGDSMNMPTTGHDTEHDTDHTSTAGCPGTTAGCPGTTAGCPGTTAGCPGTTAGCPGTAGCPATGTAGCPGTAGDSGSGG